MCKNDVCFENIPLLARPDWAITTSHIVNQLIQSRLLLYIPIYDQLKYNNVSANVSTYFKRLGLGDFYTYYV